jgi:hypothetical protein
MASDSGASSMTEEVYFCFEKSFSLHQANVEPN